MTLSIIFTLLLGLADLKENAVILILCRNSELPGITYSLREFEETFNKTYKYPYVFLNDDDFTEDFKNGVKAVISAPAEFGKVTGKAWGMPEWIDKERAKAAMDDLRNRNVIYGGELSYHNMCRFFSGYFFDHELVKKYDYYWRIEPDVNFFCNMNYDPFQYLRETNKKYGFVMIIKEFMETIPTLWKVTVDFLEKNRNMLGDNQILSFILDEKKKYNGCHFWSNFEIASFEFFRSPVYRKYFEFLDRSGGFYYERWGDAPVHTIALALFLDKSQIHFFDDIGYKHSLYQYCPKSPSRAVSCKCSSKDNQDTVYPYSSCLKEYIKEVL